MEPDPDNISEINELHINGRRISEWWDRFRVYYDNMVRDIVWSRKLPFRWKNNEQ